MACRTATSIFRGAVVPHSCTTCSQMRVRAWSRLARSGMGMAAPCGRLKGGVDIGLPHGLAVEFAPHLACRTQGRILRLCRFAHGFDGRARPVVCTSASVDEFAHGLIAAISNLLPSSEAALPYFPFLIRLERSGGYMGVLESGKLLVRCRPHSILKPSLWCRCPCHFTP
jgi:hypothetical protein